MAKKRFNKFRKVRVSAVATRRTLVSYGYIGLKVTSSCKLDVRQINAARMVITRTCNRKGKLIIRAVARFPVSKKPLEVRMGGGKGAVDTHVESVAAGAVIFELDNVPADVAKLALEKARYKLGVSCSVVYRHFAKIV